MAAEGSGAADAGRVVDQLDDALAALGALREQVASGQLEGAPVGLLVERLLSLPLVSAALEASRAAGSRAAAPGEAQRATSGAAPGEAAAAGQAGASVAPMPAVDPGAPSVPGDPGTTDAAPHAEGAGDAKGAGDAEPEPSPHHEAEELVKRLAGVDPALGAMGVPVPAKAVTFCANAGRVLPRVPEDAQKGETLAKILFEGVRVLDLIEQAAAWSRHRDAAFAHLAAVRLAITGFLARDHGIRFEPAPELRALAPDDAPGGVAVESMPAPLPAGTVLWVVSRAFVKDDKRSGAGKLCVAGDGKPGELRLALIEAWQGLEGDGGPDPRPDLEKLNRYLRELVDGDATSEANTARHTLNLLHTRNNLTGQHGARTKWLLAFLTRHQVFELPAKVGKRFDDSYKPSKYERQLEYSDQPQGTIVRIVTLGLVDQDGLPLQKCVLAVSRGPS